MKPEFIAWLNGILEWLGKALCISLGVAFILGVILFVYCAVAMQREENNKRK